MTGAIRENTRTLPWAAGEKIIFMSELLEGRINNSWGKRTAKTASWGKVADSKARNQGESKWEELGGSRTIRLTIRASRREEDPPVPRPKVCGIRKKIKTKTIRGRQRSRRRVRLEERTLV